MLTLFLSACTFPNLQKQEDPFAKISTEKVETLYGEIFPFSVSVSTRATHRLEKDNKLVALLASDIVRLEEFEGRMVEVDGVFRKEKMRPIFWVEAIRVKDLENNSEKSTGRFETQNYSFVVPSNWESSLLEDGSVHFIDKKDPNRKVFLTFAVKDVSSFDKTSDPNIVIANMAGIKKSTTFDGGQIRQEVTLFSNIFPHKKYVFVFSSQADDFSRKKDFFKLLNSFVEGEENVKLAHEEELRKRAEEELKLLKSKEEETTTDDKKQEQNQPEEGSIISRIFGDDEVKESDEKDEEVENETEGDNSESAETSSANFSAEFNNLIDDRAYFYQSDYYKFSMKVPYGLWFKNFGPTDNYLTQVGFAKHEIKVPTDAQIVLNIVPDESPLEKLYESQENDLLVVQFPRNSQSYYELRGPVEMRDYIRSIQSSIQTF